MSGAPDLYADFPSRFKGELCRHLWQYWISKLEGRIAPEWGDIDLMDIYDIAPHLVVLDVDTDTSPPAMTYRYAGTHIVMSRWKIDTPDPTGRNFDDIEHQYDFSEVTRLYHECIETVAPRHMRTRYDALDAHGLKERLVLPLILPSGGIDKILSLRERLTENAIDQPVSSLAAARLRRNPPRS